MKVLSVDKLLLDREAFIQHQFNVYAVACCHNSTLHQSSCVTNTDIQRWLLGPGGSFSIKKSSYPHRKSHCGDKTILRSSYLHNGISYTGKTMYSYWNRARYLSSTQPSWCSGGWLPLGAPSPVGGVSTAPPSADYGYMDLKSEMVEDEECSMRSSWEGRGSKPGVW